MEIDSNSVFIHEGHSLRDLYLLLRNDAHYEILSSRCSSDCNFFLKVSYIEEVEDIFLPRLEK
jgi:hypothetical protein